MYWGQDPGPTNIWCEFEKDPLQTFVQGYNDATTNSRMGIHKTRKILHIHVHNISIPCALQAHVYNYIYLIHLSATHSLTLDEWVR